MYHWFDIPLWELRVYASAYRKALGERVMSESAAVALGSGALERADRERLLREFEEDSGGTISTAKFASVAGSFGAFGVVHEQRRR